MTVQQFIVWSNWPFAVNTAIAVKLVDHCSMLISWTLGCIKTMAVRWDIRYWQVVRVTQCMTASYPQDSYTSLCYIFIYLIGAFTPLWRIFHLYASGQHYERWKPDSARGGGAPTTSVGCWKTFSFPDAWRGAHHGLTLNSQRPHWWEVIVSTPCASALATWATEVSALF